MKEDDNDRKIGEVIKLLSLVPALPFSPLREDLWLFILGEGYAELLGGTQKADWSWSELPIPAAERKLLVENDIDMVEKYNVLSDAIASAFGDRYLDFVDYETGAIIIFRCDANVEKDAISSVLPECYDDLEEFSEEEKSADAPPSGYLLH